MAKKKTADYDNYESQFNVRHKDVVNSAPKQADNLSDNPKDTVTEILQLKNSIDAKLTKSQRDVKSDEHDYSLLEDFHVKNGKILPKDENSKAQLGCIGYLRERLDEVQVLLVILDTLREENLLSDANKGQLNTLLTYMQNLEKTLNELPVKKTRSIQVEVTADRPIDTVAGSSSPIRYIDAEIVKDKGTELKKSETEEQRKDERYCRTSDFCQQKIESAFTANRELIDQMLNSMAGEVSTNIKKEAISTQSPEKKTILGKLLDVLSSMFSCFSSKKRENTSNIQALKKFGKFQAPPAPKEAPQSAPALAQGQAPKPD